MFGLFNQPRPYRTPTLELQYLDQTGLEMEWLKTKEELISTNFDKWETRYSELSVRASEIIPRMLASYGAVFDPNKIEILKYTTTSQFTKESIFTDPKGFVKEFGHHALLTMAFYCFCGRVGASGPKLYNDRHWIRSTLDSLISENIPLAFYLKGIILKHGLFYPVPPDTVAAGKYFTAAEKLGVIEAAMERITLVRYKHLSECKPANSLSEDWKWL